MTLLCRHGQTWAHRHGDVSSVCSLTLRMKNMRFFTFVHNDKLRLQEFKDNRFICNNNNIPFESRDLNEFIRQIRKTKNIKR